MSRPVAELLLDDMQRDGGMYWGRTIQSVVTTLGLLGYDFDEVAYLIRERDRIGQERYGVRLTANTLRPDGTPYDWRREAAEELADALLYLRAAIEQ